MTTETNDAAASMAHFHRVLDLQPIGPDRFRGITETDTGRLFGGLALAQSVVAAGLTVERGTIHSMHGYFLRAGRPATPIEYQVERIRDGRNFTGRRVSAYQAGQEGSDMIFEASISFVVPEEGASFQAPMPEADGPEGMSSWWAESMRRAVPENSGPGGRRSMRPMTQSPIEVVSGELNSRKSLAERLPQRKVWGRPVGPIEGGAIAHAAAIAYFSDTGIVATVANAIDIWGPGSSVASLDHAIWFHHPPRFDDWVLFTTDSPIAHSARGLSWGSMYNRDGVRIASVAQEGFFRKGSASPEVVS